MVRLVPRQRTAWIVLPLSGSYFRSACRMADKTRRLARDRRARKGVIKFPDLDADLRRDRCHSLHLSDWDSDLDSSVGAQYCPGDHRVG